MYNNIKQRMSIMRQKIFKNAVTDSSSGMPRLMNRDNGMESIDDRESIDGMESIDGRESIDVIERV